MHHFCLNLEGCVENEAMPMECRDVPARSPDVPGIFTQRYLPCILKHHKSYYMKMDFQSTMKLVMVCSGVAKRHSAKL